MGAFVMYHRPVVTLLHPANVVAAPGGHFRAQRKEHGRFVARPEMLFQGLEYPQIAPHAFTGHEPGNMAEYVSWIVFQKCLAVFTELSPAVHFLIDADSPVRHAVIRKLGIDGTEIRAQGTGFL